MRKPVEGSYNAVEEARRLRQLKSYRWGRDILRRHREAKNRTQIVEQQKQRVPEWMINEARKGREQQ